MIMTNEDFIRSRLTEEDIAKLLLYGERPNSKVIEDAKKVFDCWASFHFTKNSNGGDKKKFSIWNFDYWHNRATDKWEKIGRDMVLSRKVWLSFQYNKKEWEQAIQEYDDHYGS